MKIKPKVLVMMPIAVHHIQAKIYIAARNGKIVTGMSLREIGKVVGETAPQRIKHHLEQLRRWGVIDWIGGQYNFKK